MSQIYPKVLDDIGVSVLFTNGIAYIYFGIVVYENVNNDTLQYDSANTTRTYTPLSEFTYTSILDENTNKIIQVTVECGAYTFVFNDGEYQYQSNPLNLDEVIHSINSALGF